MNKIKVIAIVFSYFLMIQGCQDVKREPISSGSTIPGNVTDVTVKNIAGGAEISYTIPSDNDLLYVKAVYTIENGKKIEVKASMYEKSLIVKGFNTVDNTKEFPVTIICVTRSNNESPPVVVMIKPETAPIQKVKNSLSILPTFGGANYTWTNENEEPITIIFLADSVISDGANPGPLVETRVINTKTKNGSYISRGFPDQPRKFAAVLADNYGNRCDTIKPESLITPFKEIYLNKSTMRVLNFGETPVEDLWDYWEGQPWQLLDENRSATSIVLAVGTPYPRHITVDFNRLVKLSRYVMWMRVRPEQTWQNNYAYSFGNPRTWVLWVKSEPINLSLEITAIGDDGEPQWQKYWTKVHEYEVQKPSGLPNNQQTDEDWIYFSTGISIDVPDDLGPVRYFRLAVTSNYGGEAGLNWAETDFYGVEVENE